MGAGPVDSQFQQVEAYIRKTHRMLGRDLYKAEEYARHALRLLNDVDITRAASVVREKVKQERDSVETLIELIELYLHHNGSSRENY